MVALGALVIALLSVVELFGAWFTSFDAIRSVMPGHAAIAPSTATCFVFIAAMIGSLRSRFFAERVIFHIGLLWAAGICLVNLYLLALGYPQGIDGLLGVVDNERAYMPAVSSIGIMMLLSVLLIANYGGAKLCRIASQTSIAGIVGASFALFTNFVSAPGHMPALIANMSIPTQVFLLLSFALLLFDLFLLTEPKLGQHRLPEHSLL